MSKLGKDRRRPFWRYIFIGTLFVAAIGIGTSVSVFSSWSQFESATLEEATISFDDQIASMADDRAYLTISDTGIFGVQRDLEYPNRSELASLNVLAYEPDASQLISVRFPFWFVEMKSSDSLNLGTMISFLSQDWDHLDVSVTEDDLMHRGPGLVLDHTFSDGARIILWSE